jgi:EpsI family protein
MAEPRFALRLVVLSACLALAGGYLSVKLRPEPILPRATLSDFPSRIDSWSALPTEDFDRSIVAALGVDEYVNRYYRADARLAHLYVGYYRSQREGDTIHSPMNCLPGAGWQPISTGTLDVHAGAAALRVNRYVIQKGLDKQLVLYWYQSHGRSIASEYWSKIFLVLDAMRFNRTDAALVRVIAPFDDAAPAPERSAEQTATSLVNAVYPLLGRYLPS